MNDERVDELLEDLDTALAVEPSPAVAARARASFAAQPVGGSIRWRWGFVAGAALAVVAIGVGYAVWPRANQPAAPVRTTAQQREAVPAPVSSAPRTVTPRPAAAAPIPPAAPRRRARSVTAAPIQAVAAAEHEPEVLVSPGIRIALAQLAGAIRDGRISVDALPAEGPFVLPPPIVIPATVIEPFKVGQAPPVGGGKDIR
jgi:hypothetical protein